MAKPSGLVWTEAGRVGLAEEQARHEPLWRDGDPKPVVRARLAKVVPFWKKGQAKSDPRGKAAIEPACTWKPGAKANVQQLAAVASLYCATTDDDVFSPLAELIIRDYGFEIAMKVLIACWPHDSSWDNGAAWITWRDDDHQHIHDALGATPKAAFAVYLQKTHRAAKAPERAEMKRAVDAVWKTAPRHAKTALALATNDAKRAAQIARELLVHDKPHAFYAWQELPHILTDPELVAVVREKRDEGLSFRIVANLGAAAVPMYEKQIGSKVDKYTRTRLLQQVANVKSPAVARILAEYVEQKPYAETVRAYFALHPEFLGALLSDPELAYHREDLAKLRA